MDFFVTPRVMFLVCPLVALAVLAAFILRMGFLMAKAERAKQAVMAQSVHSKELLTANETEFYGRLQAAAQSLGLNVVTQVAMGALLEASVPESHPLYWEIRKTFSQKIIDFVVFRKESQKLRVLAVIELDDRTHNAEKDRARDAMMAKAGFRTIRWDSRSKPDVATIEKTFRGLVTRV